MKRVRSNIILFFVFFSLSGSVDSDPPLLEDQYPVHSLAMKEKQEIVVVSQTFFPIEHQQELLLEEDNPVEEVLDLQNQVLERQIQQVDDMGNELDKIIQMLEK